MFIMFFLFSTLFFLLYFKLLSCKVMASTLHSKLLALLKINNTNTFLSSIQMVLRYCVLGAFFARWLTLPRSSG